MAQVASLPTVGRTLHLRLPFAAPIVRRLLPIYVVLLFVVSANVLDLIGYDYSAIAGPPPLKIHVSTYFLSLVFAVFVLSYPAKTDLVRYYVDTKLGSIYFFCAANFAFFNIIGDGRNGYGMYFDTHLQLFLCAMLLPFVSPRDMDRMEKFLHWFFFANAALAIVELAMGGNVFPLTTYSPDGQMTLEPRATAFLSHPLHAATLTTVYVMSLLCGGGTALRAGLRTPTIALQVTALLAFGGRAALLLTLAVIASMMVWQALRFSAGQRVSRLRVTLAVAMVPIGVLGIAVLAYLGAFDAFFERFNEDGGSARSRTLMLPLLLSFDWADLLWGASTDFARSRIYSFGLEWGVENPFLQMSVYQGVVVATMIMSGLACLLFEVYRRLRPMALVPMGAFLLLCNTFGSYAGRFIAFTIFLVIVSTLFRRPDRSAHHVT